MALTSLALAVSVDVNASNEAGIRMELPDEFGGWKGSEIKYCHNLECKTSHLVAELDDPGLCPDCGEGLYSMTRDEADLLPEDTGMLKKQYSNRFGKVVSTTIVLSGKERGSLHRPEVCLTGQGRALVGDQVIEIPVAGRPPLKVMVLDLEYTLRGPNGRETKSGGYYAYWFIGKGRETPYHRTRMFLMAADRVLHNVAHRWAYISVGGSREIGSDDYLQEIREVVAELYPSMALE